MNPSYWLILGILLLIGETFTLDFSLSAFGIACLATAGVAYGGFNIYWQLGVLSTLIFIIFFGIRPFILRTLNKNAKAFKSNIDALPGMLITVQEVNPSDDKKGLAKIDADSWTLYAAHPLNKDEKVRVLRVEGTTLIVEKESK